LLTPDEPEFLLENNPVYNLINSASAYRREMSAALKQMGTDFSHWRILMLLELKDPCSISELSERSVVKMSTITRTIMRMTEIGLVTRTTSPEDRRVTMVHLTEDAKEKMVLFHKVAERISDRAMLGMNHEGIDSLTAQLKKIQQNLSQSPYLDN